MHSHCILIIVDINTKTFIDIQTTIEQIKPPIIFMIKNGNKRIAKQYR